LADIIEHPFVPLSFGKNKAGMQSAEEVSERDSELARMNWLVGRDVAVLQAYVLAGGTRQILLDAKNDERAAKICDHICEMMHLYPDVVAGLQNLSAGVHKQHANRVLEPYAYHTVIVTGTSWRNFYALRASPMAQPEIQEVAIAMAKAHSGIGRSSAMLFMTSVELSRCTPGRVARSLS